MKRYALAALLLLAALPARADFAFPSVRVDWGTTPPTSCRPVEIFVDTDADTDGAVCMCIDVDTWKCGATGAVTHASTHQNGGADEISVAGLSGALADPQLASGLDDANDTLIDTTDTPADGDILKYDLAADRARWAAASAGSFTNLDTDYGDEVVTSTWNLGGALLELPNSAAPTGTDCDDAAEAGRIHIDTNATTGQQVYVCEGVTGWVQQGGDPAASAPYQQYDPDNPPAACAECDEFTADAEALTWAWFNQDSATVSVQQDGVLLTGDAANDEIRGRAYALVLTNSDFTVTAKIHQTTLSTNGCGIGLLYGGTPASPSALVVTYSANSYLFQTDTDYNFASGLTNVWNSFPLYPTVVYGDSDYLQLRYVDSTRVTTALWSKAGLVFSGPDTETATLSADPTHLLVFARDNSICFVEWVRVRTDAAGLAGQVGE